MKEITIRELAKMVCDLPVNENIYVKQHVDSQLFGITCLNLFESDIIILSHFGGGFSAIFDTSVTNEEKEMYSWLKYAFGAGDNEKTVYLLDEKEAVGSDTTLDDETFLETIDSTKHLKNDTQLSLFKEWNIYVDNNEEEPHYASVSIRFKDDGSEGEVIISLTDHSEKTADRVFHYAQSLQELIELAVTDKKATVQNFIIISLNDYSASI